MTTPQSNSEIPLLLSALKDVFRNQGLRYADIAAALDISQMTVKRYLSGKGLGLGVLEQLCRLAGISLTELSELAVQHAAPREANLSEAQESALAEHFSLAVLLHLLQSGWAPQEIQAEFGLPEPVLVATLGYLDRLGFIDLLPDNRVRLRGARHIPWSRNPRLKRSFNLHLKKHFTKDFADPEVLWRYRLVKLSAKSRSRLEGLFEEWSRTVHALAQEDRRLPADQCQWHGVLFADQPVDLSEVREPSFLAPQRSK
ncbi:helix-turn-helix domain-containing protein [Denitratisoma sp. DHT3]|uniref:helix-turn-helix domain-containing protein n=1 Tax=Denitratisoma sp. DHT3 TaxID=1981880 RepID=UPI00119F15FF|nr:helix-turn-helix transcriptional regulator [Denitratisoma sp. DHT3]